MSMVSAGRNTSLTCESADARCESLQEIQNREGDVNHDRVSVPGVGAPGALNVNVPGPATIRPDVVVVGPIHDVDLFAEFRCLTDDLPRPVGRGRIARDDGEAAGVFA